MYEMLGDQCTYPKSKVLIRRIAAHSQSGARLIKADLDAMWLDILEPQDITTADLHREASEAVQSFLDDKPTSVQAQQLRELIAAAQCKLVGLECRSNGDGSVIREFAKEKIQARGK